MPCLDFEMRLLGTAILSTQPFVEKPCFEPILQFSFGNESCQVTDIEFDFRVGLYFLICFLFF